MVIHLQPREVVIEHCEACGLTHAHEETACVASKDGHGHCVHWWDAEGCCWCGDDPCAAARCALG